MTVYAPSDFKSVTVPADDAHAGCGVAHERPQGPDGRPAQVWALTCPGCEAHLLATDSRWVIAVEDIPPTYDERKAEERFTKRGIKDRDALLALAAARMAGVPQSEIPASLTSMLSGLPSHVPGVIVCGAGHDNTPGSRFCRSCGDPLSRPATAGAIESGGAA